LFQAIPSSQSNIHFNNQIIENDSINELDIENVYNGGVLELAILIMMGYRIFILRVTLSPVNYTSTKAILNFRILQRKLK